MTNELRRRAEEQLEATRADVTTMSEDEVQALVHELQVHQIELEMQNQDLREAQAALAEARDRYVELYEFAPVGYFTLDKDHIVRKANCTFATLLGLDRSALLGRRLSELAAPEYQDRCFRHLRAATKSKSEQSFAMEFKRPDRTRFWGLVHCAPNVETGRWTGGCRGTISDISEQKAAEESERRHVEQLELALDAAQMGTWEWERESRKMLWDSRLRALLGAPCQMAVTLETFFEYVHEEDRSRVRRTLETGIDSGNEYHDEFRIVRTDGEVRWVVSYGRVCGGAEGAPVRISGVSFDITERREVEEELEQSRDQLEERVQERTAKLRALAAQLTDAEDKERQRLAHLLHDDLQQQLAVLKMRLNGLVPPERRDAYIAKQMADFKAQIEDAIKQTRTLSRELSPPALRLHGLQAALEWLAGEMREKHGLDVRVQADSEAEPQSPARASFLFRAAQELLYNVVKHSGQSFALVEVERIDGHIQLRVRDEGRGFDPEAMRQKRESLVSFGLLSIEERLAFLGGAMDVTGGPEQGCSVTLALPEEDDTLYRPAAEEWEAESNDREKKTNPHEAVVPQDSKTIRVLLADDHDVVRESLASLLAEEVDILVTAQASDGHEAVQLARSVRPDVVLLDVNMPELNGIQAAAAIRAELPDTRIVGLSMHDDKDTENRMFAAGADAFVAKDDSSEDLLDTIRRDADRSHQ